MAAHRLGVDVNHEEVARLLVRLEHLAGLEAWWLTAEVAREFGVDAWGDLASKRAGALRSRAGRYAEALEREAGRRLG
jgi:hypothetical protein